MPAGLSLSDVWGAGGVRATHAAAQTPALPVHRRRPHLEVIQIGDVASDGARHSRSLFKSSRGRTGAGQLVGWGGAASRRAAEAQGVGWPAGGQPRHGAGQPAGGQPKHRACTGLARSKPIVRTPLPLTSSTAPPNSQTAATTIACFIVSALAPVEGKARGRDRG